MSVAQYPTPYNPSHTGEPAGPGPGGSSLCGYKLQRLKDEYPSIVVKEMDAGNASYGATNVSPVMRWQFTYTGLTAAQAAVLDAHYAAAFERFLGFQFRDPRTGTLYTDVHYDAYEYPAHEQYNNQTRIVTLIKRPV